MQAHVVFSNYLTAAVPGMSFDHITRCLLSSGTKAGAISFSQPPIATTEGTLVVITQSPNVLKQYFAWISKTSMIFQISRQVHLLWSEVSRSDTEQDTISHVINDFSVLIGVLEILKETKKGLASQFYYILTHEETSLHILPVTRCKYFLSTACWLLLQVPRVGKNAQDTKSSNQAHKKKWGCKFSK